MTGTCPHGWTYAHNCPTQPAPEQELARKHGGCGIVVNVDAWCDGDAVPSTAGLCDSPETHREHAATDLSDYERATVERIEAAPAAEESFDAVAALRRVQELHKPFVSHSGRSHNWCQVDADEDWPCATIRALDGTA